MSLTHVIPPEASSTLEQLHFKRLLEDVDSKLAETCFSYKITLHKPDGRDGTAEVVPRIHLNRLRYYYNALEEDFKSNDCDIISQLYQSGLGLPKDPRLAAYWRSFSSYTQPVQDGILITFDDVMHTLEAHINQAKRDSWGGRYAYQQAVNKHYQSFARYIFRGDIEEVQDAAKERKAKKGFSFAIPTDARSGFIVYKFRDGQYRVYGSWIESDNRYAPFIRQVFDADIPNAIPGDCLKDYGTYLIVPGYFVMKNSVKDIIVPPGKLDDIWDDCLDQDLFSHSDFKPEETPAIRKAKEFVNKYREPYGNALKYIEQNGKSKDRHVKRTLKKARALVKRYEEHTTSIKEFKTVNRAWDKLNPAKHLDFIAYDMFFEDPITGFRQIKTEFTNIVKKLKQCGFSTPDLEVINFKKSKSKPNKLPKRQLVRIANNTEKLDIHDLWFGG